MIIERGGGINFKWNVNMKHRSRAGQLQRPDNNLNVNQPTYLGTLSDTDHIIIQLLLILVLVLVLVLVIVLAKPFGCSSVRPRQNKLNDNPSIIVDSHDSLTV